MHKTAFLLAIITIGYGQPDKGVAAAFPAEGPGVAAEAWQGTSPVHPETHIPNAHQPAGSTHRADVWLLAPIPEAVLGGLVTIDAGFTEETYRASNSHIRQALRTGILWHPHHSEGAPRFYVGAARTGLADDTKSIRPIASYTVGSRIHDDDLPFRLSFDISDQTLTQVHVSWHRFPKYSRFRGGIGHRIRMANGLILDLHVPEHATVAYAAARDAWIVFAGWERSEEFFPHTNTHSERGWSEDVTEKRQIGMRLRLHGPIFAALSAGERRTSERAFNYRGDLQFEQTSLFVPFARLAIESWISPLKQ